MPKDTFFNLPSDKREAITKVLLDEFANQEYRSVSISAIVRKADIAKGSFYQYFEDKADAFLYLFELAMQEKMQFMNSVPADNLQSDLFSNLRWMMEAGTKFEFSNPNYAQIGYRAVFEDVPLPLETKALIEEGSRGYFKEQLIQGIAAGEIDPNADPDIGAFILESTFNNVGRHLMAQAKISPADLLEQGAAAFASEDMQSALDQVITILERGFRAK